ncbi:cytochrome-c peroxidase [Bremerella sp. JC817]|uniref:cytochrome-c peroxidase n=1 Tax=Bremerella sp. JC817 TaxID=3231756 RepID=UPI00345A7B8C
MRLGKALFFDPRISGTGQMACASCHDPDLAWSDGRTRSSIAMESMAIRGPDNMNALTYANMPRPNKIEPASATWVPKSF